jgi:hypothetical protein
VGVVSNPNFDILSLILLVQYSFILCEATPSLVSVHDSGLNRVTCIFHIVLQDLGITAYWRTSVLGVDTEDHKYTVAGNQNEVREQLQKLL